MDPQENKINEDVKFCEDCWYRIILPVSKFKCGRTGAPLRFYDRACDQIVYGDPDEREYEWDPELKAYVVI